MTTTRIFVLVVSLFVAMLVGWPKRLMAQTPPSSSPPGVLVGIGGHKMHIHCVGPTNGALSVVFDREAEDPRRTGRAFEIFCHCK